jgi:replication initiation protein RepC
MQNFASVGARTISPKEFQAHNPQQGLASNLLTRKYVVKVSRVASSALKLNPTLRTLLSELCFAYGEQSLNGLVIVWPSNAHLARRTGLSERSIRYGIQRLTELKLILPRDSSNGKRFPVRDRKRQLVEAYGFDLSPMLARADEFQEEIELEAEIERLEKLSWQKLQCARRDVSRGLEVMRAESHPDYRGRLKSAEELQELTPKRKIEPQFVAALLEQWETLKSCIFSSLQSHFAANGGNSCRHIEDNTEYPIGDCKVNGVRASANPSEKVAAPMPEAGKPATGAPPSFGSGGQARRNGIDDNALGEKSSDELRLKTVQEALPALEEYGFEVSSLSDIRQIAIEARAGVQASEMAWGEACGQIGSQRAALALLYVFQLYNDDVSNGGANGIQRPGGYFRWIARQIAAGSFDLTYEFKKLAKRKRKEARVSG